MKKMNRMQFPFGLQSWLIITALSMVVGCGGGKFYLNDAFVYEAPESSTKVAIIPAATDESSFTDSLFTDIFRDTALNYEIVLPGEIRKQISHDPKLSEIINKLGSVKYSKEDFKSVPSIKNDLTTDEISYLEVSLGNPEFILFPVAFRTTSLGVITSGFSRLRLYHLNTGKLIYERRVNLNVELGGNAGRKYMIIGLIGFAKDDFVEYCVQRFLAVNQIKY